MISPPYLARGVDQELQFAALILPFDDVALEHGGGAALGAER